MSANISDFDPVPLTRCPGSKALPQYKRHPSDRSFSSEEMRARNDLLSKKWIIEASNKYPGMDLKFPDNQYQIGKDCYNNHENFKALFWINKAVEGENKEALYLLGFLHAYGKIVAKSDEKAKELLQKSADQNYKKAQLLLDNYDVRVRRNSLQSNQPLIRKKLTHNT